MARFRGVIAMILMVAANAASAQVVYSGACQGTYAGVPMQGGLQVKYLAYSQSYGYYGVFFDGAGNRYDFEVISNQNGGVGGAWMNHARHRETHIEMRYSGKQMRIRDLYNGGAGTFTCQ